MSTINGYKRKPCKATFKAWCYTCDRQMGFRKNNRCESCGTSYSHLKKGTGFY